MDPSLRDNAISGVTSPSLLLHSSRELHQTGEGNATYEDPQSGKIRSTQSTIRGYQPVLRLFSEYLTDPRNGWPTAMMVLLARKFDYRGQLRPVMASRGVFAITGLIEPLARRGIRLSSSQVCRLVAYLTADDH